MAENGARALHYVLKTGNRNLSCHFFQRILGMKILRHEEFDEGCKATCNGPYEGRWSKTMIGYGSEADNFVIELTYNYGVGNYRRGNDFHSIHISSPKGILERVKQEKFEVNFDDVPAGGSSFRLVSPCGYTFIINEGSDDHNNSEGIPILTKVSLSCSKLDKSVEYYTTLLKMQLYEKGPESAILGFAKNQAHLEMKQIEGPVRREAAFGRTAFSIPSDRLPGIEQAVKDAGQAILTPLVSLDTPGKATVEVVILADPDGHEICFVGDEAFRELSQIDPDATAKLAEALDKDKSADWFKKQGKDKEER